MPLNRRELLQAGGVLLGSAALPSFSWAESPAGPPRALLLIQLAGGNDGLNTAAPLADADYAKLRPTVGLKPNETLDVGAPVALHASLAPLVPRFKAGQLALVQGVGYPKPSRSHFEAIEVWQSGDVKSRTRTGWVARAFEKATPGTFSLLSIGGGGATPALRTDKPPPAVLSSLDAFAAQLDKRSPGDAPALLKALTAMYGAPDAKSATTPIRRVGQAGLSASEELKKTASSYTTHASYPRGGFGDQLKLAMQMLSAPLGVRVAHVVLGGFDTHANQKRQHQTLMGNLADGIAAVLADAEEHELGERLLVMTYSEFGRRVAENGSGGTDHGAGSVLLVAGAQVKGGLYGQAPALSHLDGGDVPVTLDFRSVYASVLKDWLHVAPQSVIPGGPEPLSLIKV
jgi:uncharacterized protein (DUF1501 family)